MTQTAFKASDNGLIDDLTRFVHGSSCSLVSWTLYKKAASRLSLSQFTTISSSLLNLAMPRAPTRFNNASQEDQYFSTDATWNSIPPYPLPTQPSGTNYGQGTSNQWTFPAMQQQMPSQGFMPPYPPATPAYQNAQSSGSWARNPYNNPAVLAPPRAATQAPPRAPTQIDNRPPDYWHNNKHLLCINKGRASDYPMSISFRPSAGPCSFAVAMLNLELGRGMVEPNIRIDQILPPAAARFADGALLLKWPGYYEKSLVLTLIDPRTRRHVTRAQLGAQVTQLFKDFINSRTEEDFFEDTPGGAMRLGVDGIQYDQVRLAELYTTDGMTFRPQFALNAHFLTVDA
ncbi:hypothetical protein B0H15DRAFT_824843 [Mycena belliarum]|uniref:Uncharacterized protein n=1 Tax=Mycena belliarum TaxID=1033014 RepID=A0AAD6XR06_9AGAR|nr:hypothetical protein B0H15DRAFT_824843 [Mycena belliae]